MSKISVKLLINKDRKRVVCAEAGSDFIDVLFSFLSLPLGSIVRLLGKQSGFGSLDSLYEGVEKLDNKHLKTESCKQMLLNPRSSNALICEDLKIKNVHDDNPRRICVCLESDCLAQSTCYYTYINGVRCRRCGKPMTTSWIWRKEPSDEGGIFVKDTTNCIITDDLRVIPTCLMSGYSLLEELRIKDANILEERVIDFGTEEVLNLLRRSFESKNPLTEVCLAESCLQESLDRSSTINELMNADEGASEIKLKLILNKKNNNVLYAEAGEDFVNQLLSFLTFPLGSVLRFFSNNALTLSGCITNLYSSVEDMNVECFKSKNCRNILLTPKLATFHGFEKQILKLDEITSKRLSVPGGCPKCYHDGGHKSTSLAPCKHGIRQSVVIEQNPKSEKSTMFGSGGFVAESRRFLIADNLHISPLSFMSAIKSYETNSPIFDLIEKEVCVDKAKALSLLNSMLISKTVLTDVFCRKPMRSKRSQSP